MTIPLLFLFLVGMLLYYRVRRRSLKQDELYQMIREITEPAEEKDPAAGENTEPVQGEEPKQKETNPTEEAAPSPDEGEDREKRRDGS